MIIKVEPVKICPPYAREICENALRVSLPRHTEGILGLVTCGGGTHDEPPQNVWVGGCGRFGFVFEEITRLR